MMNITAVTLPEDFEIVTERLRLRLHDVSLASPVSHYYVRNRAHFAACCPLRDPSFHSLDAWQSRSAELRQASLSGQALQLLLFRRDNSSDEVVGDINFTNVVRGVFQAAYLGYDLDREQVGRGFMHEALSAAIAHVFGPMNLHRIMANYVPTNERSARVLRRLGFQVEGFARDYLFLEGQWKDHLLTSLSNPKFKTE